LYFEYAPHFPIPWSFNRPLVTLLRTAKRDEIAIVLERADKKIAIECKASTAQSTTRSLVTAINDVQPERVFVVVPVTGSCPLSDIITVTSPAALFEHPTVEGLLLG